MEKRELMKYLVDLHKVYVDLKENKETIISNELNNLILETGENYYSSPKNNTKILSNLNKIQFLLEYINELSANSSYGNYSKIDFENIIKKGEKICLDLEKMKE